MIRRLLRIALAALALLVMGLGLALGWAHRGIRSETPVLPGAAEVTALAEAADRPVRLAWVETASQCTPAPEGETCIVHPAFVLEWADGRLLLIDAGMEADAARSFGAPMQTLLGSDPAEPGRALAAALGPARNRVTGIVFTHLHNDHTQGIAGLCPTGAPPLTVFQTPGQSERGNYTVAIGRRQLAAAPCVRRAALPDQGLGRLPGFPGVGVVRAAGHTPGSQMVVAWVGAGRPRGFVLAGDVVFAKSAIDDDRAKPHLYSLLVTPENEDQLARVRAWLRELETQHGVTLIPSHDQAHLEGLGLPRYSP